MLFTRFKAGSSINHRFIKQILTKDNLQVHVYNRNPRLLPGAGISGFIVYSLGATPAARLDCQILSLLAIDTESRITNLLASPDTDVSDCGDGALAHLEGFVMKNLSSLGMGMAVLTTRVAEAGTKLFERNNYAKADTADDDDEDIREGIFTMVKTLKIASTNEDIALASAEKTDEKNESSSSSDSDSDEKEDAKKAEDAKEVPNPNAIAAAAVDPVPEELSRDIDNFPTLDGKAPVEETELDKTYAEVVKEDIEPQIERASWSAASVNGSGGGARDTLPRSPTEIVTTADLEEMEEANSAPPPATNTKNNSNQQQQHQANSKNSKKKKKRRN